MPPVELAPVEVEKRIEPAPRKLDPAAAWRSASRVKKAIFVLTAPMMIALLVSSARGHASQSPSVASTATKPASTSPMATTKGSAPAASMTTPTRGPAAQPAASSPSKPTLPTAKNELALKDRTPERRALDAAAVGDYPSAAEQYAALASEHPDNPAFNEAARILNAKRSR